MLRNLFPARGIRRPMLSVRGPNKLRLFRATHNTKKLDHQVEQARKDFIEREKLNIFRIITNEPSGLVASVGQNSLAKSNIQLNDVELHLTSGKLIFNLTWLRDSCHCELCTHKPSRQRHFTPKKFEQTIFNILDVQLIDSCDTIVDQYNGPKSPIATTSRDSFLSVVWSDGHRSLYSLNWLKNFSVLNESMLEQIRPSLQEAVKLNHIADDFYSPTYHNNVEPEYWTSASIKSKLQPIKYEDLIDGYESNDESTFINSNKIADMSSKRFDAIWSLSHQLMHFGLAKVINVPQEKNQVLKMATSLAYARPTGYGTVFNVVVEKSDEKNLAYSSAEFDLHVDLAYREKSPGVQLLHCIKNSKEGGSSYFSDAFYAAKTLQQEDPLLFDALVQYPLTFSVRDPYRDLKFRHKKTALTLDGNKQLNEVYYSPWALPPIGNRNDIKLFYLSIDRFTSILHSNKCKFVTKMDDGDLFIFHNRRVLHGRSAYDASVGSRFLQGCYMDWDEIVGLHEKLNTHKYSHM